MLIACGLSHKTAPLAVREKVVFSPAQLPRILTDLQQQNLVTEATILSTCNRTEIYCDANTQVSEKLLHWLADYHHLPAANLSPYWYTYADQQAVRHIFQVASGVDSMIIGEPQIFGQLKEAVNYAEQAGTLRLVLRRLFQHAFQVGKKIRTHTFIARHPVSLGYLSAYLAKRIFADVAQCRVLLVGAGEIAAGVARHLQGQGVKQLTIVSRTLAKAEQLAETLAAQVIPLDNLAAQLAVSDIVITAVRRNTPLIGKGMVESALKTRKHRPMLMVDLAVPRNIEPEIHTLEDVYLYSLDALQTILQENRQHRLQAVNEAEALIELETQHFLAEMRVAEGSHLITAYRRKMKKLRDQLLTRAMQEIAMGDHPQEVLEKMAHQLTNKLLHDVCVNLRQAAYHGEWELLKQAEKLLSVDKNL